MAAYTRATNKTINLDAPTMLRFKKAKDMYKTNSTNNVFVNYLLDILDQYPSDTATETETEDSQSSR